MIEISSKDQIKNSTSSTTKKLNYFWLFIISEIVVAVIVRILTFKAYHGFFINDAYIFLRYAENMARGNGLIYNIGERVLGYSSPLYVILLAGFRYISMNLPAAMVTFIFNLCLFIASSTLITTLILNRGIFGLIFFTFYCFYFSYVDASVNGMETILMLIVVILVLNALKKDNIELALIFATISFIIRPEGTLCIVSIIIISLLFKKRLPSFKSIMFCTLILLLWLIPTYLYFRSFLPQSLLAKSNLFTGQGWSGIHSGIFEKAIMLMFGFSDNTYFSFVSYAKILLWTISCGFVVLFFIGFFKSLKQSAVIIAAGIFFILLWFFYSVGSPVRMFSWYTIIPSILFMMVVFNGAEYLLSKKIPALLGRFCIAAVFVFCIISIVYGLPGRTRSLMYEVNKDRRLISYLDKTAPGIKSIMISDIGYIGYWKPWRIIDGSGLVSPNVLNHRKGEVVTYLSDIFTNEKPDIIYFKVEIMDSNIIDENMRYATFRDSSEREFFLNNYTEVSKPQDFAEIFIRKSLLITPNPSMLK